ncbi:MAG: hypothetical protein HOO98_04065 [Nitrospira sp.]|nr:hypothetical protein [Nitrospira sp.]
MHKIISVVLLIVAVGEGCSSQSAMVPSTPPRSEGCSNLLNEYVDKDHAPELVVYEGKPHGISTYKKFAIDHVDQALAHYFANKQTAQPVVLYIHGRALKDTKIGEYDREPEESRNDIVPVFSAKYHLDTVLMLHWPHRRTANAYPEDDARFASNALLCTVQRLNSPDFNATKYPGIRALVTHSMGALVLEQAVNTSSEDMGGFDVASIFAAANRANSATSWLSKIRAHKQYVVVNTSDIILTGLRKNLSFMPLGMCDRKCFEENPPADNVVYLDVTCILGLWRWRHDYFVKGEVAEKVVTRILSGESPPMGTRGVSDNHRIIREQDLY